jgi:hypothetical protein
VPRARLDRKDSPERSEGKKPGGYAAVTCYLLFGRIVVSKDFADSFDFQTLDFVTLDLSSIAPQERRMEARRA